MRATSAPTSAPTSAAIARRFNTLIESAPAGSFPHPVALVVDEETALAGRDPYSRACASASEDTVFIAPKLLRASKERQLGVLMHELAHVHLLQHGKLEHSERDADRTAKALWGRTIRYDDELVQTIGPGTHPRPAHLG